jgi:hypothetical protein
MSRLYIIALNTDPGRGPGKAGAAEPQTAVQED